MNEEIDEGHLTFLDPATITMGQLVSLKPTPDNFEISMGEAPATLTFQFYVEKNLGNRLKYWLFCKFFPFKISRWD